ncbi:MAG: hypothetical protein ACYDEY_15195 [Acidimicrobiales bacterium]
MLPANLLRQMLHASLTFTARWRILALVELGHKVRRHLPGIESAMLNNLSIALIDSTNAKLRVLHRMAFHFLDPEHLIALFDRGASRPALRRRH